MTQILPALLLLLAIGLAGCKSGKTSSVQSVNSNDAASLNAQHSRFDEASEPPLNADTRFAAGQLAESQNLPERAIEQYEQAIRINPRHRNSLYRLGVLYAQARRYPKAIEAWNGYLKATEDDATGYSNLGYCHELAGDTAAAEDAYKRGIEKDPVSKPCRVNYGLLLARLGRLEEATAQLQAVLPPAHVHYNLASVHEQLGHKDQAKAEYQKALELDPTLRAAQARLAAIQ